jgi:hypothetical protein
MRRISAAAAAVVAATLVTVPSVPAGAAAPGPITVKSIVSSGPGCPPGSIHGTIAKDRVALVFDDFSVHGGPAAVRKRCSLTAQVALPTSVALTSATFTHRGAAYLAAGTTSVVKRGFGWTAYPAGLPHQDALSGPLDDLWSSSDVLSAGDTPCGGIHTLYMVLELSMSPDADPTDSAKIESFDGGRLVGEPCTARR